MARDICLIGLAYIIAIIALFISASRSIGTNEREDTRLVIRPSTEPYDNRYYDKGY